MEVHPCWEQDEWPPHALMLEGRKWMGEEERQKEEQKEGEKHGKVLLRLCIWACSRWCEERGGVQQEQTQEKEMCTCFTS